MRKNHSAHSVWSRGRLPYPKCKKPSSEHERKEKSPEMSASNKAVTPAILVLLCIGVCCSVWLLGCASIKEERFYRDATRKPTCGCNGFLNRHGKRIAPLARIHTFFQAALCGFSDSVIRAFTGLLQRLHRAIRLESPQHGEETASLRIEGNVGSWA